MTSFLIESTFSDTIVTPLLFIPFIVELLLVPCDMTSSVGQSDGLRFTFLLSFSLSFFWQMRCRSTCRGLLWRLVLLSQRGQPFMDVYRLLLIQQRFHFSPCWTCRIGAPLGPLMSSPQRLKVFFVHADQLHVKLQQDCGVGRSWEIGCYPEGTVWHILDRRHWTWRQKQLWRPLQLLLPCRLCSRPQSWGRRVFAQRLNGRLYIPLDLFGISAPESTVSMSIFRLFVVGGYNDKVWTNFEFG